MSAKRAYDIYNRRLGAIIRRREKELEKQDQADYDAYIKRQENMNNLIQGMSIYNSLTKQRLAAPTLKLQETYMDRERYLHLVSTNI